MSDAALEHAGASNLDGYLAEFETVDGLYQAAVAMREAGYTRWDAHSPFPVHGLDDAMGLRGTRLPWIVLLGGVSGAGLGLLLQWWTNAVDYPVNISGKPFFSLPASIPVTFETTILLSALSTVIGMLALNRLPQYWHPIFRSARFKRATSDRFFISVEAADPRFDADATRRLLESLGAAGVERLERE